MNLEKKLDRKTFKYTPETGLPKVESGEHLHWQRALKHRHPSPSKNLIVGIICVIKHDMMLKRYFDHTINIYLLHISFPRKNKVEKQGM